MPSTLLDIIQDSLQYIGQVGTGQNVSPEQSQLGLRKANRMLQKWSVKKLLIYVVTTRPITLAPGTQSYTMGPTGVSVGTRPVFVESGIALTPGSSMSDPLNILDKSQWDALPDTGVTCGVNGAPASVYVEYGYPNLTLYFTPIPSAVTQVRLGTWELLQQFVGVNDVLALPPGYEEAITYNLSVELAGDYDQPVTPDLAQLAADALNAIQTNNAQKLRGGLSDTQTLVSPNVGIPPPAGQ